MNESDMKTRDYEIKVIPKKDADGDTYWTASFPAVDGCIGGGKTPKEAIDEAYENLEVFLEYLESVNSQKPVEYEENSYSGRIALRIPKSKHKKLAEKSADEGVSINMLLNCAVEYYLGLNASSEHNTAVK